MSGELEIGRGDLAQLLYERTRDDVGYVFGDRVSAIAQDDGGVDVTFGSGRQDRYDLVVGADGLHSGVRAAVLAPERDRTDHRGYVHVGFTMPNVLDLDHEGIMFNEPGRGMMVSSGRDGRRATAILVFSAPDPGRLDPERAMDLVERRYAGADWVVPKIVRAMRDATDLYAAPLCQLRLSRFSHGRVVLVGDAAWCAGPGGSGTGLAMAGAYVLAAELHAAQGEHRTAFDRFEAVTRPAAETGLRQGRDAGAAFLAPATHGQLYARNLTMRVLSGRVFRPLFDRLTSGAANALPVDGYPEVPTRVAETTDGRSFGPG